MKKEYILWGICGAGVLTVIVALLLKKDKESEVPNGKYGKYYNGISEQEYKALIADFANNRELVSQYAQDLHNAMKDAGTDFNKILEVMSNLDEVQMKIVYDRFGRRAYYNRLFGKVATEKGKMLNLKEWFKEELSEDQYKQIRDRYPKLF